MCNIYKTFFREDARLNKANPERYFSHTFQQQEEEKRSGIKGRFVFSYRQHASPEDAAEAAWADHVGQT